MVHILLISIVSFAFVGCIDHIPPLPYLKEGEYVSCVYAKSRQCTTSLSYFARKGIASYAFMKYLKMGILHCAFLLSSDVILNALCLRSV